MCHCNGVAYPIRVKTKLVSDTLIIYCFEVMTGFHCVLYFVCLNQFIILLRYCRTLLDQSGKVLGLDPNS